MTQFHHFIDVLTDNDLPFSVILSPSGDGSCIVEYAEGWTWFTTDGKEYKTFIK